MFLMPAFVWAQDAAPDSVDASPADAYTPPENARLLERLADLYRQHAGILDARAAGDLNAYERGLDQAILDLRYFIDRTPEGDAIELDYEPEVRSLYRTIVSEYEFYYGDSDTLGVERGDIFAFRDEMFAAMNADLIQLEDVEMPDVAPLRTTIPMPVNKRVRQSISYLRRTQDRKLSAWRQRAHTYFPMIEQVLREEGMPDELKYLAMIESGLNPKAKSWARAGGMWQFIVPTGRAYGLEVNAYVDERMDPEKATRAAARHVKDLYAMFNQDWHLALAGYNCSPARVKRAVRRAQAKLGNSRRATFWDAYPYLPRETRNYVPGFIAAAIVSSNPAEFGLDPITPGAAYEFDRVPVQHMLDLKTIAELTGTSEDVIRALNPEIRLDIVPPTEGPYMLRVPLGSAVQFSGGYEALTPEQKREDLVHTVASGESIRQVARRYGVSLTALKRANGLRSNRLDRGQRLSIPVRPFDSKPGREIAEAGAGSIRYGALRVYPIAIDMPETGPATAVRTVASATDVQIASAESTPARSTSSAPARTHRVRRGETLSGIASRYRVSVSQLKSWNNLRSSRIRSGQRLKLYGGSAPAASSSSNSKQITHVVRRGDTLGKIGRKYGVSVANLKKWNGLRGTTIRRGQRLKIYASGGSSSATSTRTHRVRRGETLGAIAKRYGVRVSDVKRWNGLKSSRIYAGQRLTIRK